MKNRTTPAPQRYMQQTAILLILVFVCGFTGRSEATMALYVSPDGKDTNPGSRERPLSSAGSCQGCYPPAQEGKWCSS